MITKYKDESVTLGDDIVHDVEGQASNSIRMPGGGLKTAGNVASMV